MILCSQTLSIIYLIIFFSFNNRKPKMTQLFPYNSLYHFLILRKATSYKWIKSKFVPGMGCSLSSIAVTRHQYCLDNGLSLTTQTVLCVGRGHNKICCRRKYGFLVHYSWQNKGRKCTYHRRVLDVVIEVPDDIVFSIPKLWCNSIVICS